MMTYFFHDSLDAGDEIYPSGTASRSVSPPMHILWEKAMAPMLEGVIKRPRLNDVLSHSVESFEATLLSGRAATGKTAAAAELADGYERTAWYSVDSTDADWGVFANYLRASILGQDNYGPQIYESPRKVDAREISQFIDSLIGESEIESDPRPMLIVVDNLHHVFDADWFTDFFQLFIASMPDQVHLLFLCRSKPPTPIWRLRSKQVLNVIDEKVLAFTPPETVALFKSHGRSEREARKAHEESFGRVGRILDRLSN